MNRNQATAALAESLTDERLRPFLPDRLRRAATTVVAKDLEPVPLDPGIRAELTELYREDIVKLQALIDRDLSHWLETS